MKPVDNRIILLKVILENKEHLFGHSFKGKESRVICRELNLTKRELMNCTSTIGRSMGPGSNSCEKASFNSSRAGWEIFAGYNMAKLA